MSGTRPDDAASDGNNGERSAAVTGPGAGCFNTGLTAHGAEISYAAVKTGNPVFDTGVPAPDTLVCEISVKT